MDTFSATSTRNQITVINADSFVGYQITRQLLREQRLQRGERDLHVTATTAYGDNREVRERMEKLKRLGANVQRIDYSSHASIERTIKNADWVIIVPENERDRVSSAVNVIEAVHKEQGRQQKERGGPSTLLISRVGADSKHRYLKEYRDIEKKAECLHKLTTFRIDFVQETFWLWAPRIQDKNCFPLSVHSNDKFAPVAIDDISKAVHNFITRSQGSQSEYENKQTYVLTGPESLSPEGIVRELNHATNGDVHYQKVSREDLRDYLRRLRDHEGYAARAQRDLDDEEAEEMSGDIDRRGCRIPPPQISEVLIETFLDFLDLVNEGKADFVCEDLRKLIHEDGRRVEQFFRDNRNEFHHGSKGRLA
jgi:uncharacterized protein YbjT (DUF2867 family)